MRQSFRKTRQVSRNIVLAILLIFVVFLAQKIVLGLFGRAKPQSVVAEKTRAETVEKQFEAAEYSGTKKNLVIKADNFSLDEEQNQHLEGQVEVTDESVEGKVVLRADKLVIPPDRKKIMAEEGVEVNLSNLRIKARQLEYSVEEKMAKALEAQLLGDNIDISVQNLRYAVQSKMAMFEGSFEGRSGTQEKQFSFTGRNAIWENEANLLKAEELRMTSGQVEARGQKVVVRLQKETGDFDTVKLEGSCSIFGRATKQDADFQEIRVFAEQADIIHIGEQILILAEGAFRMEGKGQEWTMGGTGVRLNLNFKSQEGLDRLLARDGHLKFTRNDGEENELSAESIEYGVSAGDIFLKGQANGLFKDYDLKAKELRFKISDRSFSASDFQMLIKSGFFSGKLIMFSEDKAVYVTGKTISGSKDLVSASGQVRTWQEDNLLTAGKMTADRKTSNLSLEEEVSVNGSVKSVNGRPQKISLAAARVLLLSEEHRIEADGQAAMSFDDLKLNVPQVKINLDPADGQKLISIELIGALEVKWKDYLARGRRAFYQADKEKLEVSGSPELITQEGNRVEADKLTLYLADDRILVENRKRERSQVILVRGK